MPPMTPDDMHGVMRYSLVMWSSFLPVIIASGYMRKADAIMILDAALESDGLSAVERKMFEMTMERVRSVPDVGSSPAIN